MRKGTVVGMAVLVVLCVLGLARLGLSPSDKGLGAAGYLTLVGYVRDQGKETGDYPKSARELAEAVGSRLVAKGGPKVSYLHGDLVLLEKAGQKVEVEYKYVSADKMPKVDCLVK